MIRESLSIINLFKSILKHLFFLLVVFFNNKYNALDIRMAETSADEGKGRKMFAYIS